MTVSIDALAAMAEIEAAADAAEVASGGRPNRFGNRQLTPRTTDYANPISQKFTGQTLNPLDTVLINNAGDVVLDTVTNPYVSQDYTDFGLSGKTKAGNFTLSNALQDQAALQTDEDLNTEAGLASKINDLIQSINPFKSDWAQKNLYGKQSVAGPGYLPEKMTVKEYADAVAWVKTNFPDQDYQSATQIFEKAPTGTLTTAQQNQALVEQANISDEWLSEHMAQPHLSRTLNMLGSTGLITQAQQAENDIGAPGSWYGGTPVQEELGSGVGALSPSNINVSISQAVQDLQNQLDLSNLLSKESVDIPGTTRSWPAIPSQSWPAIPSQVMQNTQAEQDETNLGAGSYIAPSVDQLSPGEQERVDAAIMKELTTPTILEGAADTYPDDLPEYDYFPPGGGGTEISPSLFEPDISYFDELPLSKNKMDEEFWSRPLGYAWLFSY